MDETPERHGQHAAAAVIGAASAVVILGAALPWLHSGARSRSSFDLVAVAQRLGLSPDGWQGLALRLWPVVPLACVLATVAAWWGRHTIAAVLSTGVGVASLWLSWEVRTADLAANLRLAIGPSVTIAGALASFAAAGLLLVRFRRA